MARKKIRPLCDSPKRKKDDYRNVIFNHISKRYIQKGFDPVEYDVESEDDLDLFVVLIQELILPCLGKIKLDEVQRELRKITAYMYDGSPLTVNDSSLLEVFSKEGINIRISDGFVFLP